MLLFTRELTTASQQKKQLQLNYVTFILESSDSKFVHLVDESATQFFVAATTDSLQVVLIISKFKVHFYLTRKQFQ